MNKLKLSKLENENLKYIIFIFLISVIAFWQITLFQNVLRWDFLSITIPWRFFIGENINQGLLPMWSPYAKLGFPLYFDPQTWYPVSWIIAILFHYSIYSANLEFVFHIFIAGLGVYFLAEHFIENKKFRFISAITLMLSGFFIGNAQHMGWIVSGAWIPFVLNSYLNIYKKKSFLPVFSTILFSSLLLTGGYFPFFLTTIYTLFVIFIVKCINFFRNKEYHNFKIFFIKNLIFTIFFTFVNLVVLLSILEANKYIPRGTEITIQKALGQSITPKGLITFIFPFTTIFGDNNFWGSEKTVMNSYFGIIGFLTLIFGIFIKKNKQQKLLLLIGLFAFMTSMGHVFPFRRFFYYTLPFFKYFRFPSLFRYFGIIAFSLFFGITLSKILENKTLIIKLKKFLTFILLFLIAFLIFLSTKNGFESSIRIWAHNQEKLNFYQAIIIQIIPQILFISLFISTIYFVNKSIKTRNNLIVLIIVLDMVFSVQLNAKITVIANFKPETIQSKLNKLPKNFPIPDIHEKIINNSDKIGKLNPLWKNLNYYYKKIAFDGYGPYQLNNFTNLEKSAFFDDILNNNFFYFAKNIQNINSADTSFIHKNYKGILITDIKKIINQNYIKPDSSSISIKSFNPKDISLITYCDKNSILVFMQNYFPSWKAYIDGKETKIVEVNYSLQAIYTDKGYHKIEFKFENKKIQFAAYFSALMFFSLLITIIFKIKKDSK